MTVAHEPTIAFLGEDTPFAPAPIVLFIREVCELISEGVAESVFTCQIRVGLDACAAFAAATSRAQIEAARATQSPRTKQLGQMCSRKTARTNSRRTSILLLAYADYHE